MDAQLDLFLQKIFSLSHKVEVKEEMYMESEFKDIWEGLVPNKSAIVQSEVWLRTSNALYCEGKFGDYSASNEVVPSRMSQGKQSSRSGANIVFLFVSLLFFSFQEGSFGDL